LPQFSEKKIFIFNRFFYDKISEHSITLHCSDLNIVKSPWSNHPYSLRAFQATRTKLWFQRSQHNKTNKGCVTLRPCHLLFKVSYGKWRIVETQIFHHVKNILFKKPSKTNQNPSRYYNSITNLKFQHKPKYHLSKILI
jgi:hypothetical protein